MHLDATQLVNFLDYLAAETALSVPLAPGGGWHRLGTRYPDRRQCIYR